jgi:hypothetical protein
MKTTRETGAQPPQPSAARPKQSHARTDQRAVSSGRALWVLDLQSSAALSTLRGQVKELLFDLRVSI